MAPGLRWVRADGLHLTVRFVGNTDEPTAGAVREALRAVRAVPFEVELGALGTFGGRNASVLWLGVARGSDGLAGLAAGCETAVRAAGVAPEDRPFRPHLTLARAGSRREALPALPPPPALEPWRVDEFVLFQSRRGPGGSIYTPLETYRL